MLLNINFFFYKYMWVPMDIH